MNMFRLGIRYERLLILAAPISFACILMTFIAVASEAVSDNRKADCYDRAATLVEQNFQELEMKWGQRVKIGKVEFANEYVNALAKYMIYGIGSQCDYKIGTQDTHNAVSPIDFLNKLKMEAEKIREEIAKRPIHSYGVEIPEKVKIEFVGIAITVGVLNLAQVLQLMLAPILILWLGSLFNTRFRETILIERAKLISDLYPHCINIYMCNKIPELRKRSILGYFVKIVIPFVPTISRILLLSIFIVPPAILYCAGLIYLKSEDNDMLPIAAGLFVILFAFLNLALEMNPWHSGKVFPSSKFFDAR